MKGNRYFYDPRMGYENGVFYISYYKYTKKKSILIRTLTDSDYKILMTRVRKIVDTFNHNYR